MDDKKGKALSFDGSTSYVDIPLTVNYPAITVSAWFKATNLSFNGNNPRIVSNSLTQIDHKGFELYFNFGGGAGLFDVGNGTTHAGSSGWNQQLVAGQWYHYVGVYDGSNVMAYLNGVLVQSNPYVGGSIAASGIDVSIGRNASTGDYFDGAIDDVRIYNRALSATEVAKLYQSGSVIFNGSSAALQNGTTLSQGLVGLWTFDGKDINWNAMTATDRSGQGNTGTLVGLNQRSVDTGHLGQALTFDGGSTHVDVSSSASLGITGNITMSAWIKTNSPTADQIIASRWGGGGTSNSYALQLAGSLGQIQFFLGGPGTLTSSAATVDTHWHFITATYDGANERLYEDGAQIGSQAASGPNQNGGQDLHIGYEPAGFGGQYFSGTIDDVRIYNRALSAAEVKQLYKLGTVHIHSN